MDNQIGYIYVRYHESYEQNNACKLGKTINIPASKPQRTIIPNVKQTKVKPVTALSSPKRIISQASKSSFGTIENRAKTASTTVRANTPVVWKSKTSSLNTVIPTVKKSPIVSTRLAQKRVGK
jgi:hypothetical protein